MSKSKMLISPNQDAWNVDKDLVKEALTTEQVIELMKLLGATTYEDMGEYIRFPTICHNTYAEDAGLNLSYYKASKQFYCFSECHSMDIYQVILNRWKTIKYDETIDFKHALMWVLNTSQVDIQFNQRVFSSPIKMSDYKMPTTELVLPEKNENVLDLFEFYQPIEWKEDGISTKAMQKFGILFNKKDNSIIIPHRDVHGRLVGIRRRSLNKADVELYGKYKPIYIENQSYAHPLNHNLYGFFENLEAIKRMGRVYVAEGEKSVLQAETLYGDNNIVVAVCGSRINRWQVHLLMKYAQPREIVIAFDKGLNYEEVERMARKYSVYTKISYIRDPNNYLRDKESPFDRPDVLEELIDKRVRLN